MTGTAQLDEVVYVTVIFTGNVRPVCARLIPAPDANASLDRDAIQPAVKRRVGDVVTLPIGVIYAVLGDSRHAHPRFRRVTESGVGCRHLLPCLKRESLATQCVAADEADWLTFDVAPLRSVTWREGRWLAATTFAELIGGHFATDSSIVWMLDGRVTRSPPR